MMQRMTEQPMLRWASSCAPEPRLMLTKAQQPSPIMTASASATTVSGKTIEAIRTVSVFLGNINIEIDDKADVIF